MFPATSNSICSFKPKTKVKASTQLRCSASAQVVTTRVEIELKGKDSSDAAESQSFELSPGQTVATEFSGSAVPIRGVLRAGGSTVEFFLGEVRVKFSRGANEARIGSFLVSPFDGSERQRLTVVDAGSRIATLCTISGNQPAQLDVTCRAASENELKRNEGITDLIEATRSDSSQYSHLHATIVRARNSFVDSSLLDRAIAKLTTLEVDAPEVEKKTWIS